MDSDLTAYIKTGKLVSQGTAMWGDDIHLDIACYLGTEQQPLQYVSSVRAIVFRDEEVLVVRGPNGYHVMPGGQMEKGEEYEETLQREILEETGWTLGKLSLMGFMHFHHLTPEPTDYPYPYPDFLWLLYVAEAAEFNPQSRQKSEWELAVDFYKIDDAKSLYLETGQLELLESALTCRKIIQA